LIWIKHNNFIVRESNGIKSKFLLNFLGKLLVIMQNIILCLIIGIFCWNIQLKKKGSISPIWIFLGVVEQAKSMEGTKHAQWVLLGNCLIYKIINKTSPSSNVRKKFQTCHMTLLRQLIYKPHGVPNVDMRY
jgi:hypothetical protein